MEGMAFVDEKGRVLFSPAGCGEDEGYTIIQLAESGYTDLLEEIAERFANYEQRLKAYEDIGLTPMQLTEVDRLYAEKCRELAEAYCRLAVLKSKEDKLELLDSLINVMNKNGIRCWSNEGYAEKLDEALKIGAVPEDIKNLKRDLTAALDIVNQMEKGNDEK